jgi:hypothetical protein
MTREQMVKALRADLDRIIEETPKSGALNAGKKPLHVNRFRQAVEAREHDDGALLAYVAEKVTEPVTTGYNALLEADALELTVEWLVADETKPYAELPELVAVRPAARARLGEQQSTVAARKRAAEEQAVARDREIVADVRSRRNAKGQPPMTREQEAEMLARLASKRH